MTPGSLVRFQAPHYISEVDGVIAIESPEAMPFKRWLTGILLKDMNDGTSNVFSDGVVMRVLTDSVENVILKQ